MAQRVIDTNVFSFRLKGDSRADRYEPHLRGHSICLSFMTVAELFRWTIVRRWGPKRVQDMHDEISQCLILPYDEPTAWEWAKLTSVKGRPMAFGDAWIAAAALRHGMALVTHNPSHFRPITGLIVISET